MKIKFFAVFLAFSILLGAFTMNVTFASAEESPVVS